MSDEKYLSTKWLSLPSMRVPLTDHPKAKLVLEIIGKISGERRNAEAKPLTLIISVRDHTRKSTFPSQSSRESEVGREEVILMEHQSIPNPVTPGSTESACSSPHHQARAAPDSRAAYYSSAIPPFRAWASHAA